jgi:hypothetical protein
MQVIVLTALIVVLPLAIAGFVAMWREQRDKKLAEQ